MRLHVLRVCMRASHNAMRVRVCLVNRRQEGSRTRVAVEKADALQATHTH